MRKSIVSKYYLPIGCGALVCFIILTGVLLLLGGKYYLDEKRDVQTNNAQFASKLYKQFYDENDKVAPLEDSSASKMFQKSLYDFAGSYKIDVYITDVEGNVLFSSVSTMKPGQKIDEQIVRTAEEDGRYLSTGLLEGLSNRSTYITAVSYNINGEFGGVVLVTTSLKETKVFISNVMGMFLLATITVTCLSLIGLYYIVGNMAKPLKKMSEAAMELAKGNFDVQLDVDRDDEIGHLATAFNSMANSLSQLEKMRSDFIADVSHELKTPMTTIGGFIDGILDGAIPKDKEAHYLGIISEEIKRLSRLVNTLLDVARIQNNSLRLNMVRVNISDVMCRVVAASELRIKEKQIHLIPQNLDQTFYVNADVDAIYRVLYNVFDNAVKYVNEGGSIDVRIKSNFKTVFIGVKNSGGGIAKEDAEHLFDRFYKVDKSRGLDKKSTGLGLYIAKTIANMHNGDIWVSSLDGFTEFVISLPMFGGKQS